MDLTVRGAAEGEDRVMSGESVLDNYLKAKAFFECEDERPFSFHWICSHIAPDSARLCSEIRRSIKKNILCRDRIRWAYPRPQKERVWR